MEKEVLLFYGGRCYIEEIFFVWRGGMKKEFFTNLWRDVILKRYFLSGGKM